MLDDVVERKTLQGLPHPGAPALPQQGPMNHGQSLALSEDPSSGSAIKLGLDNIRTLLAFPGGSAPPISLPSSSPGRTAKDRSPPCWPAILTENGFRTGLYTSPHLVRVEERIRIGDGLISARAFGRGLTAVRETVDGARRLGGTAQPADLLRGPDGAWPSFISLREAVDFAVLEVGMGGRFDATNAVTPLVSVITTISLDHQKYLGDTLEEIAFEKAGIIKPGVPVVCGVRRGTALRVIRRRAQDAPGSRSSRSSGRERPSRPCRQGPAPGSLTIRGRPGMNSSLPCPASTRERTQPWLSGPPRSSPASGGRSTGGR